MKRNKILRYDLIVYFWYRNVEVRLGRLSRSWHLILVVLRRYFYLFGGLWEGLRNNKDTIVVGVLYLPFPANCFTVCGMMSQGIYCMPCICVHALYTSDHHTLYIYTVLTYLSLSNIQLKEEIVHAVFLGRKYLNK